MGRIISPAETHSPETFAAAIPTATTSSARPKAILRFLVMNWPRIQARCFDPAAVTAGQNLETFVAILPALYRSWHGLALRQPAGPKTTGPVTALRIGMPA